MKLYAVRIFVHDFERACSFYRETLGLEERFRSDEMGWAEYAVGGPSLGIERVAPDDAEGQALIGRFLGVSLEVEDVHATFEALVARGVTFASAPAPQPWGGVLAHLEDHDHNTLTLLSRRR